MEMTEVMYRDLLDAIKSNDATQFEQAIDKHGVKKDKEILERCFDSAVWSCKLNIVKYLDEKCAYSNIERVLKQAIFHGDIDMLQYAYDKGCKTNNDDYTHRLKHAINSGYIDVVKSMIEHNTPINQDIASMLLTLAMHKNDKSLSEIANNNGANLNDAIYNAANNGYIDVVKELHQKGAAIDMITLHAGCNNYDVTQYLFLQMPEDIDKEKALKDCLYRAIVLKNNDVAAFLFENGAKVDDTLILQAIDVCNVDGLQLLYEKGADIRRNDYEGLHNALMFEETEVIQWYREQGIYIDEYGNIVDDAIESNIDIADE